MFAKERIISCKRIAIFLVFLLVERGRAVVLKSGVARNLSTTVFEDTTFVAKGDGHGPLKLNITWQPPLDSRNPSSYSILITSLPNHDGTDDKWCPEETLFSTTWDGNRHYAVLPENQFSSDVPELSIRPTCTYGIQVFANPRSNPNLKAPEIIFTVPECVGKWCACAQTEEYLPIPDVHIVEKNWQSIDIRWTAAAAESPVNSYVISLGIPFLMSNSRLPVYNTTKIANVTSGVSSFLWLMNTTDLDSTSGSKVMVAAQDIMGCLGTPGTALIDRLNGPFAPVQHPVRVLKFQWAMWVGFVSLSMLLLGAAISLQCVRNRNKSGLMWAGQSASRFQGLIGLSRTRSQWADSTLRERNVLYVEQEIQAAINRGDADYSEVSYGRLKFIRELGKGQFGKVYLGTLDGYRDSLVAIKMSNSRDPSDEPQARQQFLGEIETMKIAGSHPHLVGLVGTCTLPENPICVILEYLEGGDLLAHLHRIRDCSTRDGSLDSGVSSSRSQRPSLTESTSEGRNVVNGYRFASFALDIARGMKHLESRGVIHRDLAARNVLLTADMTLKISDFGLSRNDGVYIIGNGEGVRRLPVRWMAPEALRDREFTSKSDVWSYAVVLWEIGTLGAFPFYDIRDDKVLRHVLRDEGRLRKPENVSPELYEIMRCCWASRPENRPNFGQIVQRLLALGETSKIFNATSNPCYSLFPTKPMDEDTTVADRIVEPR